MNYIGSKKKKYIMSRYGTYRCFTQSYRRFKADKDENRNISKKETIEYLYCLIKEETFLNPNEMKTRWSRRMINNARTF